MGVTGLLELANRRWRTGKVTGWIPIRHLFDINMSAKSLQYLPISCPVDACDDVKKKKNPKNLISSKSGRREEMICLNEQPYWPGGRSYLQHFSILNRICQVGIRTHGQEVTCFKRISGHACCAACCGFPAHE